MLLHHICSSASSKLYISLAMEALWKLEDKWKLSTQKAILLFVCTAFLLVGSFTATALKKKRSASASSSASSASAQSKNQLLVNNSSLNQEQPVMSSGKKWYEKIKLGWSGSIKRVLMSSVRWSRASKWDHHERTPSWRKERQPTPLALLLGEKEEVENVWQQNNCSHNSVSPVWQRPILMGEKCELPRFSGLILYDERGLPLHHSNKETPTAAVADSAAAAYQHQITQEKTSIVVRTTLRDLL